MGKSLVIVESPAKAKTINKYLGRDYVVKSSVGHIRDLPTGSSGQGREAKASGGPRKKLDPATRKARARAQLVARMGVDPEHGWKAQYEVLPGKEKVVDELRRIAKSADAIYLATDLDREGEAIAWHLMQEIGGDPSRYHRVVFNEITARAVKDAFGHPGVVNENRVNAQQARRFLDRVVGFMVSPLLWAKIARGLSAGRVQSVAVRLIVEREAEIRAFVPEEFWELKADLLKQGLSEAVRFDVTRWQDKPYRPGSEKESDVAVAELAQQTFEVAKREDKPRRSRPAPPFITSTLQQAASQRLGFSVKKTMTLAQRLYEAGHITYMRTDSTNLSMDAVNACRDWLDKSLPAAYLPEKPRFYSSKKGAQEAHEAIRPSDVKREAGSIQGLERDAERLYELIWRRFVACQMADAEFISTSVQVSAGDFELRTQGRVLKFDGFQRINPQKSKSDEDRILPDLQPGDSLRLEELLPSQHFTKPPARYNEASLVKELESRGIGRPSTYASIISTIQERGYVKLANRRFYAEKMGDIVTERLVESFSDLLDYGFTADMESRLDRVADGEADWIATLDEFYQGFRERLERAEQDEQGMRANLPVGVPEIDCPACGRNMQIRTASTGVFLGCSGYQLPPKERCKATINLVPGDEVIKADDDDGETRALQAKRRCPLCGTAMDHYLIDEHRKLHVCGRNPDCPGAVVETGQFRIKGYEGPTLECDKCGSQMQLKTGRFGKYFGCTNPSCKNTRKLLRNGEPAPPKMDPIPMPELACRKVQDHYVLRDGASGLFLAASQFPKNRETRPPQVAELLPHAAELDPKYRFLLDAPVQDDQGLPTYIRYSRKTKEQYVASEDAEGKATGWTAWFDKGAWQVREQKKTRRAKTA